MDAKHMLDKVVAMEVALEWEREKKRIMEEALRYDEMALEEKMQERSMLMADKERAQAHADIEINKGKLIDDFMDFLAAVENNDLEESQKFDEKAMMNDIAAMINRARGNNVLENMAGIPVEESMGVFGEAVVGAQATEGPAIDGGERSTNAGGNSSN